MTAPYITALVGLTLLACATPALAQSGPAFDCSKTEHEVEDLICQNEELAGKDRKMAKVYKQAIAAMEEVDAGGPEAIKELKVMQRGWIGGRNDCWKAEDKRLCTAGAYDRRIAEMQAKYILVDGGEPVFYMCNGNPAYVIVATFIPTDPPSVRLERGDTTKVGILSPSGSGSRYDADFGVYFWVKGDEVQAAWPPDNEMTCVVRK